MTVLGPEAVVADELVLPYDPTQTQARADAWRKGFFRSLIGLGLSVIIAAVIFLITRWNDPLIWFFYGFFGLLNLYRVANALIRWRMAVGVLRRTAWGTTAIHVDRDGIQLGQTRVPWQQLTLLQASTPWSKKDSYLQLSVAPPVHAEARPSRPVQATVAVAARAVAAVLVLIGAVYAIVASGAWVRSAASVMELLGTDQETLAGLASIGAGVSALIAVGIGLLAAVGVVTLTYATWWTATGQGRATIAVTVGIFAAAALVPFSWPVLMAAFVAAVVGLLFGLLTPEGWLRSQSAGETLRLDQVPVVLSTIDQAVRTLSAGQVRIDTRQLDR